MKIKRIQRSSSGSITRVRRYARTLLPALAVVLCLPACAKKPAAHSELADADFGCPPAKLFRAPAQPDKTLTVTAKAYTAQSVGRKGPRSFAPVAANGRVLTPDLNAIAISPDLFDHGLHFDKKVRISGLDGEFTVMDTMGNRHVQTIDIYFGHDQSAARQWGSRTLTISWD